MKLPIYGEMWDLYFVPPQSEILYDNKTYRYTIGTTDPIAKTIYIQNDIEGELLRELLQHEISHAYSIESKYPVSFEVDEKIAGFAGVFSDEITGLADYVLEQIGEQHGH